MVLEKIKERIFGHSQEQDFFTVWDYFMQEYGWISFEEFAKLNAGVVARLLEIIDKRNQKNNSKIPRRGMK